MGLLASFHAENKRYIQAVAALTRLAEHTQDSIENAGAYLLNHEFQNYCDTWQKSNTQKMIVIDDGFGGTYQKTWLILNKALEGAYDIPAFISPEENNYCWLKDDFFGFPAIRALDLPEGKKWLNDNSQTTDPTLNYVPYLAESTTTHSHSNQAQSPDPFLLLLDLFSVAEAACLISHNDPIEMERCKNDTNFDQHYPEFIKACNLINAGWSVDKLDYNNNGFTRESLQIFLLDKGIIIKGFNDHISTPDNNTGNPTIGHADATHYQRERDQYKQQAEQLQAENEALQQRIAELEAQQPISKNDLELPPISANNAAKIISALANIAKVELGQPYAVNGAVKAAGQLLGIEKMPSDETFKKWATLALSLQNPN